MWAPSAAADGVKGQKPLNTSDMVLKGACGGEKSGTVLEARRHLCGWARTFVALPPRRLAIDPTSLASITVPDIFETPWPNHESHHGADEYNSLAISNSCQGVIKR